MAFPKKGRRTITVRGRTFHWRVVGIDEPEFGFAVWRPDDPHTTFVRVCIGDPMAVITPSMVAEAIDKKLIRRKKNPE
jgi:hypothetical protein